MPCHHVTYERETDPLCNPPHLEFDFLVQNNRLSQETRPSNRKTFPLAPVKKEDIVSSILEYLEAKT